MSWYRRTGRDLPWRRTSSPYKIWVSEVMLQQTQVKTVIPYYFRFLETFPTIEDLAGADLDLVLKHWEGLGYYARARNLHKAAQIVVNEYSSQVPDTPEAFKALPGVGDYICAAVLSIAFNRALAVVDGNVKRVLSRLFCMDEPVNHTPSHRHFAKKARDLLDLSRPEAFNQAMMELGALVCKPGQPDCNACPLTEHCCALKQDRVHEFPKRNARPKTPLVHIAAGVIRKNNRILITKRKPEGLLGGLWEFPGGKLNPGETPEAACLREIKEETNLEVRIDSHLTTVHHAYTHFKIRLEVFCCTFVSGRVRLNGPVAHKWITLNQVEKFAFPKANHKFIHLIKAC